MANSTCSYDFWSQLYPDTPLSPLGELLASLPASQAMVERVFNCADWLSHDRERLGLEKLFRETYIRTNYLHLQTPSPELLNEGELPDI